MEHVCKRRRIATEEYSNPDFHDSRARNDQRLKLTFESIFEKYNKDFSEVGDEIDMHTGQIVIDNGHIQGMADELDIGDEDASSEEEDFGYLKNDSEDPQYVLRNRPNYHDRANLDDLENESIALDAKSSTESDSDNDSLMGDVLYSSLDSNMLSMDQNEHGKLFQQEKSGSNTRLLQDERAPFQLPGIEYSKGVRRVAGQLHNNKYTHFKSKDESAVEPAWRIRPLPQPASASMKQRVVPTPKIEESERLRSLSPTGTSLWTPVEHGRPRLSVKNRVLSYPKVTSMIDSRRESPVHMRRQAGETDIFAVPDNLPGIAKAQVAVLRPKIHTVSQSRTARNNGHERIPKTKDGAVIKAPTISQRWTFKEDELLRRLKLTTTLSYNEIKQHFPGRGESAVRFHWYQLLGYMTPKEPSNYHWTPQDNDKLLDLRLNQKLPWERVAEHFENRTLRGVRCHYHGLKLAFASSGYQLTNTIEEIPKALAVLTDCTSPVTRERSEEALKSPISHRPAQQITPPSSVKSQPKSTKAVRGQPVLPPITVVPSARLSSLAAEAIDSGNLLACAGPESTNTSKAQAAMRTTILDTLDKKGINVSTAVQAPNRKTSSLDNPNLSGNPIPTELYQSKNQLKPKQNTSSRSSPPRENHKPEAKAPMSAIVSASPIRKDIRNLTTPKFQKQNSEGTLKSSLPNTSPDKNSTPQRSLCDEAAEPLNTKVSRSAKLPGNFTITGQKHLSDGINGHEKPSTKAQCKPMAEALKNGSTKICGNCQIKNSSQWRYGEDGEPLCNSCGRFIGQPTDNLGLIIVGMYWARTGLDRPKSLMQKSTRKRKRSQVLLDIGRNPGDGIFEHKKNLSMETVSPSVVYCIKPRTLTGAPNSLGNAVPVTKAPNSARQSASSRIHPQAKIWRLRPADSPYRRELSSSSSPIASIENSIVPRQRMVIAYSTSSVIEDLSEDELSFL